MAKPETETTTSGGSAKAWWAPLAILCAAQFIMVLDSSVMNVSISAIVEDLDTTIQGVQLAITAYTLVMASFMLLGAKLGDIYGRDKTFAVGLAIYGTGSFITAISPNLGVLLFGWSLIEGLGAALVMPAIVSLVAANYHGERRAFAFGAIAGTAGVAIAAGPLIGGWVTTAASWRYVFAAETVVVIFVLMLRKVLASGELPEERPKLDGVGVALSSTGLALIVFAIVQSSSWGLIEPRGALTINGNEITPLGFSVVPFLIAGGFGMLAAFSMWEERRERLGLSVLMDRGLLRNRTLVAGLSTLTMQQMTLLGTFFVLPVYLQVVLGLDAFETGKKLFPLSIAMFLAAVAGPRLATRISPKAISQLGFVALIFAALVLLGTIDVTLDGTMFAFGLVLFGIGAGLLVSQLGNVVMSSVPAEATNEAGGLQGTAQNLGASLGTALIGAILIAGLGATFTSLLQENPDVPPAARQQLEEIARTGIPIIPVDDAEQALVEGGLSETQASAIADDYGEAQLFGLKQALGAVAVVALASLWFTRRLPAEPLKVDAEVAVAGAG